MPKHFNTAGPIVPEKHYHLPPLERVNLKKILELIEDWNYFVLHAPRQTGKTTVLGALETLLNDTGRYRCVYVNVEAGQTARGDVGRGMRAILGRLGLEAFRVLGDRTAQRLTLEMLEIEGSDVVLGRALFEWALLDPSKPLVLLIDEIDSLVGDVVDARERLILRRETHLDQLADKLREPRLKRVVEPIVTSGSRGRDVHPDDVDYARDLGLISPDGLTLANPIYREVIPRELTFLVEPEIQQRQAWYVAPDGRLITTRLLEGFQSFFRENSESWVERFQYKEAGPQLLLQAFLQRVVNAGGRIEREYGVGRRRMDLAIIWRLPDAAAREQRVVIECKILHAGVNPTINEGLPQTVAYMDTWAAEEGHLVLFDRSPDRTWDEKVFRREEDFEGRNITVWGM